MEGVNSSAIVLPVSTLTPLKIVFSETAYIFGIINNLGALGYLLGSEHAPKNARTSLVLKCLAVNDLVAVLGMSSQLNISLLYPSVKTNHWFCVFRALWRSFGLGSGCIICVMAVDRWLALTRPFFYQKYVTVSCVKKALFGLWATYFLLACLPFLGFGLYYKADPPQCMRYKLAQTPKDVAYAYLYLACGFLLCCCLVLCNVAVMRSLTRLRTTKAKNQKVLIRRISKNRDLTPTACTSEEVAFARAMMLLCTVYLCCWLPQLLVIPVMLSTTGSTHKSCYLLMNLGDVIFALHFVFDPYLYVLQQWTFLRGLCKRKPGSRGNSVKNTTHEELVTF